MFRFTRLIAALAIPLMLTGCLVTPGKFISTLDIRADRTFTFTYKGEVLVFDMGSEMAKGMSSGSSGDNGTEEEFNGEGSESSFFQFISASAGAQDKMAGDAPASADGDWNATADNGMDVADNAADAMDNASDNAAEGGMFAEETNKAKMEAIAAALMKERGYRSVKYMGGNKFEIDYQITGTLDHGFVYPFNIDAEILFPFIAIELRGPDKIRVKAPGFAHRDDNGGAMGGGAGPQKEMADALNGTFTLTTDADIVSQNQEDGATIGSDGRRTVTWKVTPLTKDAPSAVLRVKVLN